MVEDAAGNRWRLTERLAGTPSIAHFWATWCAPCRVELPDLAAFLAAEPEAAARMAVVSVDTKPTAKVRAFLDEVLSLTALPTVRTVDGTPGQSFGVLGYPSTAFLTADGTVARLVTGPLDWSDDAVRQDVLEHLTPE